MTYLEQVVKEHCEKIDSFISSRNKKTFEEIIEAYKSNKKLFLLKQRRVHYRSNQETLKEYLFIKNQLNGKSR